MSKRWRRLVLTLHILCAALWLGGVAVVILLSLVFAQPRSDEALLAIRSAIVAVDYVIIIPAAVGSLVTGLFFAWRTKWGLTRFYWVIVKWTATTTLILIGILWLGPWVDSTALIARAEGLSATQNADYSSQANGVVVLAAFQAIVLVCLVLLSTFKPWGRRNA